MNIYFLCATKQGLDLLNLISNHIKIEGVITLTNSEAKKSPERQSAKEFCKLKKIKCIEVKNYSTLKDKKKILLKQNIDYLFCISWQRLIPNWLIENVNISCIGAHGSHSGIQKGRGRSPLNWSLILGKKNFYISLFIIKERNPDSGDLISTKHFKINQIDNIYSSYLKMHLVLKEMIIKFVKQKKIKLKKQNQKNPRYLPKIDVKDGQIDWNLSTNKICSFINSKSFPYSGAFSFVNNVRMNIYNVTPIEQIVKKEKIGKIILKMFDNKLLVQAGNGLILIESYNLDQRIIVEENNIFSKHNLKKTYLQIIKRHKKKYPNLKLNQDVLKLL